MFCDILNASDHTMHRIFYVKKIQNSTRVGVLTTVFGHTFQQETPMRTMRSDISLQSPYPDSSAGGDVNLFHKHLVSNVKNKQTKYNSIKRIEHVTNSTFKRLTERETADILSAFFQSHTHSQELSNCEVGP